MTFARWATPKRGHFSRSPSSAAFEAGESCDFRPRGYTQTRPSPPELAQEPAKLGGIEMVPAHHGAIEEQHRDMQAVPALELGIAVDVHDLERRKSERTAERL